MAAWRRLPKEYAIYATLVIIVCTSSGVSAAARGLRPLHAGGVPAVDGGRRVARERRLMPTVLEISSLMLIFYSVEFARWAFIG